MPKVSVIVPVYGVEKYIERCARSLFEQTLDDMEFIFVDDSTPDKSIEILLSVLEEYPNRKEQVIVKYHKVNKGLPIARQMGLKVAKGDYIIHCDSDDWVDRDMYKMMYEKADKDDADMVVCGYEITDGTSSDRCFIGYNYSESKEMIKSMLYKKTPWAWWNKLIKSSIYHNQIEYTTYNMGEDMVLVLQLTYYCRMISYVNKPYYKYFNNSESISRNNSIEKKISRFQQGVNNTAIVDAFLKKKPDYRYFKKAMNMTKYLKKCFLDLNIKKCKDMWKETYPFVELKILIDKNIPFAKKKRALKDFVIVYF